MIGLDLPADAAERRRMVYSARASNIDASNAYTMSLRDIGSQEAMINSYAFADKYIFESDIVQNALSTWGEFAERFKLSLLSNA